MIKTIGNSILFIVLMLGMIACSGIPKPTSEVALSESALKDAEIAGAREHAPLEFRRAKEKHAEALAAMKKKDYVFARQRSDESRIDAELAEAKSFAEKSSIDVQALRTTIDTMLNKTKQGG